MADGFSPSDFNAVVQTVAGEGANQPPEAQRAIASTILNRHAVQGGALADIASDSKAYNGARTANAKAASVGSDLYKTIAGNIAPVFTEGPTTRATHFVNPTLQAEEGRKQPGWAQGEGEKIGDHVFYDRSDLLKGASKLPSADELEQHFTAQPAVQPVESAKLPDVPGYIADPSDPSKSIPIGGPSADELEGHFAKEAPAKPLNPAALAAAGKFEGATNALGRGLVMAGTNNSLTAGAESVPFFQGLSQGFGDEAKGAVFGGVTGAKNFALNAFGQKVPYSMEEARDAATAANRDTLHQFSEAHPFASTVAEVTGGVLPWLAGGELLGTGKAVAEAPSALGKVVQYGGNVIKGGLKGTALGATGGAISGFGNAEGDASQRLPEALQGAETGAALGGVLGAGGSAVAPVVSKVASALGGEAGAAAGAVKQGVTNALDGMTGRPVGVTAKEYWSANSPTAQKVRGALTPADVAETVEPTDHETRLAQTRVLQMMQAKGMHPDELRAVPEDIPHTTAEAIGSQTVNHVASLARRAGTTPDAAASQIAQRAEDFAPSVMDDFAMAARIDPRQARVLNEDVTGTIHKDEVTPAYQAALDVHHPKPVMSPALAKLQQDPDVQSALTQAERLAAKTGRPTSVMGTKIDPDTGGPVIDPVSQQPVYEQQPTPEVWDQAKKFVGQLIKREHGVVIKDGPDGIKNLFLGHTVNDLTGALKEAVPGYDKALASASDELSRKAAYKAGSKVLFDQTPVKDFADARAKMTPDEKEASTAGVANALFDKAQRGLLTPAKLKQPLFQAKVREVLGDRADMFLERVAQRARLQATGNRIMPGAGSQTTPLLQASEESSPIVNALGDIVKEAAHAKASPVTFAIKHGLKTAIGDKAANVSETPGYRNAYGRILLQHPRVTADELRNAPPIKPRMIGPSRAPASALGAYAGGQSARPQ